jgi:acetyltransferase
LAEIPNLERLFYPSSIAVVGASNDHHKAGGRFVRGLLDGGYSGRIYPVNPGDGEIMGIKSVPKVLELPDDVDVAIVSVPARSAPGVVADCSRKRVKFVVVHSAGFAELGVEGKALQDDMLRRIKDGITRLIGPNCMGMYVPGSRINTIVYGAPICEPGGVAFVGQSGWVTENIVVLGRERGLRFSKILSIGNQSDVTIEDVIEYLAHDADTGVIGLYAEGIRRGREFFNAVSRAGKKKPIIIWKSGRSTVGARSASSHTGSLAGDAVVFDAFAAQTGLIQAYDLGELMDLMVGFSCPVYPEGKRIALLCESGGGAVSGGDSAENYGLELPELSSDAQEKLTAILTGRVPPFARPRNPVDLVWGPIDDPAGLFAACGRIMLSETDAAVMLNYQKFDAALSERMEKLRDEMGKPIFIVPGYVTLNRQGMATMTGNGLPAFDTPAKAIKALAQVVRYRLSSLER